MDQSKTSGQPISVAGSATNGGASSAADLPAPARAGLDTTGASVGSGASFGTSDGGPAAPSSDHLRDAASRVADRVGETVGGQVETTAGATFDRAGSLLDHVADAIERAGDELRPEEAPVADLARMAAGQLRGAAGYLQSADLETLRRGAVDFARRQPALYIGGALALGVAVSRFLKASPPAYGGDMADRFSAGMTAGRTYGGDPRNGGSPRYGAPGYGIQGSLRSGSATSGSASQSASGAGLYGAGTAGTRSGGGASEAGLEGTYGRA